MLILIFFAGIKRKIMHYDYLNKKRQVFLNNILYFVRKERELYFKITILDKVVF